MRTNGWEKKLAEETNRVAERTSKAVSSGYERESLRKKLVSEFVDEIGKLIQKSADIFNQSSQSKIKCLKRQKDRRGNEYCGFEFDNKQIWFVDTDRGFVRVDLLVGESVQEAAFILARLSKTGTFITWDEKNVMGVGNRLEPVTLKHLVRKYMTMIVTR